MSKAFFQKYSSFLLSGTILAGLVILYFLHPPFESFINETVNILLSEDKEQTRNYFEQFGIWGPLVIIVFIILQMFLIVFPSFFPIIVAVMAYGFWLGVLISLIGVFLASTIGYFIGVKLQGVIFRRIFGEKKIEKIDFWITHYGFVSVILFRISPFLSNDAISFIAGMLNMDYKRFIIATFSGMIPLSLAIGYFSEDISTLEEGLYWIGGAGIVIYVIYIVLDYKKRKKK